MQTREIEMRKAVGQWQPNHYLTNLAMSYFEEPEFASQRLFPVCPVELPSGYYYTFSKADLARDNVQRKPDYGAVAPAVLGQSSDSYNCDVYQIQIGIDRILALPYQRSGTAGDPARLRVKTITEQIALHQELDFASNFFKPGVWENSWSGAASANAAQKKFKRFDDASSKPVDLFDSLASEIRKNGRRKPNKLALGVDTFKALKNNPQITERIKYTGTSANPAVVTEQVLAQLFGVEKVVVLDATYNAGKVGKEDMQFICDSKGALLFYAPDAPQIDVPSAGMTFTWLISGNDYIAIDTHEGLPGTHTDIVEGVIAYDMKITSQALGIYLQECVG